MIITSIANKTFEKVCLDIVGLLETTQKGNSYLLTIQDGLSKFSLAIPLPKHTANTIARAFVENFICHHGLPKSVLTDQGPDFMSKIFKECCKLLKINKINTTAYHPQSNGALE
jgi:transposase InsO family protein